MPSAPSNMYGATASYHNVPNYSGIYYRCLCICLLARDKFRKSSHVNRSANAIQFSATIQYIWFGSTCQTGKRDNITIRCWLGFGVICVVWRKCVVASRLSSARRASTSVVGATATESIRSRRSQWLLCLWLRTSRQSNSRRFRNYLLLLIYDTHTLIHNTCV
jgi:hypothetical protein